jgi:hypothetical protein
MRKIQFCIHFVDVRHEIDKQIWLNLQSDVFDNGLFAEFSDFLLENPGLSIQELDRQFRNEWDL